MINVPFGRTLAALIASGMFATGQLYLAIPLAPAMAADWGSQPGAVMGTITAFGLAYAAGFLVFGPLSDRIGRRRVMVYGLLGTALTTLLVATASSLELAYPLRILQGFATASFAPAALAYLGERIVPHRRGIAIASLTSSFMASASLAQLGGQALAAHWRAAFVAGGIALVIAAGIVRLVLQPDPAERSALPSPIAALGRLARDRRLVLLYLAALAPLAGFVAIFTAFQLSGDFSSGELSALRAGVLPAVVAIPFAARWLGRIPAVRRYAYLMLVAAVLAIYLAVVQPGVVVTGIVIAGFVFAIGTASPALVEAIGARVPEIRGTAVSVFTAMLFVGASAGAPLANAAGTGVGIAVALLSVAGAGLALGFTRRAAVPSVTPPATA
ncbi:MFS transporter [Longispora albida]|uniref:MFS transporter n=1 Tax=Longispora albida TaxID=203523 RepID=UPI000375B84D|nr:MFS transporter [Longispora albida]